MLSMTGFALHAKKTVFETAVTTVKFDHRVLALTTFALIVLFWSKLRKTELPAKALRAANALLYIAVLQVALGITTLLMVVPIFLGAAHQAVAMLLLTVALYLCHCLHGRPQIKSASD